MIVKFKRLHPNAKIPVYAKLGDAGADLFAVESYRLRLHEPTKVRFGFAIEMMDINVEGQVRPRSGLSLKGVDVKLGTIDSGYRGEVSATVTLTNPACVDWSIYIGAKVAQLVFSPIIIATFEEVEELTATERGAVGYGSTGV